MGVLSSFGALYLQSLVRFNFLLALSQLAQCNDLRVWVTGFSILFLDHNNPGVAV